MSDTPTPPALSPEEWTAALKGKTRHAGDGAMFADEESVTINFGRQYDEVIDGRQRHALAALCLYLRPWGFSSEDVKLLKEWPTLYAPDGEQLARLRSLASRIASLLPPDPAP